MNLNFSGTAGNPADYTRSGTSIVIPPGSLSRSITPTAAQDSHPEPNETIIVDIGSVTNGTESGTQQVTATIVDDDVAIVQTLVAASGVPTSDSNNEPSNPMTLASQLIAPSNESKNIARLFDDFNVTSIPMTLIDEVFAKASSLLFG